MAYRKLTLEEKQWQENLLRLWSAAKNRKDKPISQSKAADFMSITQGAVGQYLNGKIPLNTDAILLFSKYLEVFPGDINPTMQGLLLPRYEKNTQAPGPKYSGKIDMIAHELHLREKTNPQLLSVVLDLIRLIPEDSTTGRVRRLTNPLKFWKTYRVIASIASLNL